MIRVISKKFPAPDSSEFVNYIYKLGEAAKCQKGFLGSNSYWCANNTNIYVMSDWASNHEWNKWKNSRERKGIQCEYKKYINSETYKIFNKYNRKQNIFLM